MCIACGPREPVVELSGRLGREEALGYNDSVLRHGAGRGVRVKVVKRVASTGLHVLPRRWLVERTFGWLMQHRRLARDYETLPQRSRTMVLWAMANKMRLYLTGESTQTWRND